MIIRELARSDSGPLLEFLAEIPEADRNFFKHRVSDPHTIAGWCDDPSAIDLIACNGDDDVVGHVAVRRRTGWSSHVGEISLLVRPEHRRQGVGRALAREALVAALQDGMSKLTVEVAAEQMPTVEMFKQLGFEPEALLRDFIRDRAGRKHDLIVLVHRVEEVWSEMRALGIADTVA
jgi:ribosomal protein S18 acetylase RimI-like enzyme